MPAKFKGPLQKGQKRMKRKPKKGVQGYFPSGGAPRVDDSRVIPGDEAIAKVLGNTGFGVTPYYVNPGNATTFPMLSKKVAGLYQRYQFDFLQFYYRPEVSAFATNGQQGKVLLGANADISDPPPSTQQELENLRFHADAMPYNECGLTIPGRSLHPSGPKYVRGLYLPGGADVKTYDAAVLYAGAQGTANASNIGEIRVRYRVRLFDQVSSAITDAPNPSLSTTLLELASNSVGTVAATPLMLTMAPVAGFNPYNLFAGVSGTQFSLPPGNYSFSGVTTWYDAGGDNSVLSAGLYESTTSTFEALTAMEVAAGIVYGTLAFSGAVQVSAGELYSLRVLSSTTNAWSLENQSSRGFTSLVITAVS
jgi:hypothetical protein